MASASQFSSTLTAPAARRELRILYVDDVRELREVARLSFLREGHQIECFAEGALALQRMTDGPAFDLVITDHHMPGMNGTELVQRLRENGFPGKIMVFSSELGADVAQRYQQLGVDRILYKPVYPSELRRVIAELFDLPLPPTHSRSPFPGHGGRGLQVSLFGSSGG